MFVTPQTLSLLLFAILLCLLGRTANPSGSSEDAAQWSSLGWRTPQRPRLP